jgi:DNA-binding protein StpA
LKGGKKRQPRPAKYRFTDHTGAEKTWIGQGSMPKPLARAVAEGKSLDSFLISYLNGGDTHRYRYLA